MWFGTTTAGLVAEPSRRSSMAAMTMVAVLPAPTAWASKARPSVRMRATAARWWVRGGGPLVGGGLEDVVRNHHRGLGRRAEPAKLHGGHDHGGCRAGADGVGEQGTTVGEDASHGGTLVGARSEGPGESRQSEVGAVVDGQDGRGEELVVAAGEALGPLRVLPQPCRDPCGWGLLLRSEESGGGEECVSTGRTRG